MCSLSLSSRGPGTFAGSLTRIKLWQLAVLVAFVAIAIVDIREHGHREPILVAMASAGYAVFGVICWLSWNALERLRSRVPALMLLAGYVLAMALLFLLAVVAYLVIAHVYLVGSPL